MFPATTERTAAVTTDLEAGAVLFAGVAAPAEVEVAGLVVATSAGVLTFTSTAVEALAVFGVLVWVIALVVLVVADMSRARRRAHMHRHQHSQKQQRRLTDRHWWGRR